VEPGALRLGELIEFLLIQQFVQTLIERMPRSTGQLSMRNPELLLTLPVFPRAHDHIKGLVREICG
jgi:hypothetical protein